MLIKRYELLKAYQLTNIYLLKFRTKAIFLELLGEICQGPTNPQSIFHKTEKLEWGIYEYEYAGDYIKLLRTQIFRSMVAKEVPQNFSLIFERSELLPLHEVLIEHSIKICKLNLISQKVTPEQIVYTVSI